jgi:Cys-tRNA(Pro)/Cys-tRNA(Cys) deacylase
MKINKTNAIRLLESHGISFETQSYEVDEADLSGETVARKIGVNPDEVFKTLVAQGNSRQIFVFCIPVTEELQLKKAALASGEKSIELVKVSELLGLTGYIRGGCSPVGMKKVFPTYIDETAQLFEKIYVSAGVRGMQIRLTPDDLVKATGAVYSDLI